MSYKYKTMSYEDQAAKIENYCRKNPFEPEPIRVISLEEALKSSLPVYSKAINISSSNINIEHVSKALINGDAIYLDAEYVKFTKDVYVFNVLQNRIILFRQDSSLKIR